jgi:nicotinamidase-related amidase
MRTSIIHSARSSVNALLVIDVQQSFLHRPYFSSEELPAFIASQQLLIDRCRRQGTPVLQIFHEDESQGPSGAFSRHSGLVATMPQLDIDPTAVFRKQVHSAMFGRASDGETLEHWLRQHGIGRVIVSGIRTEQCCETTARHASDLGFGVSYAIDATLTFAMTTRSGRSVSPAELREHTELVLAGRFAEVVRAEAVSL